MASSVGPFAVNTYLPGLDAMGAAFAASPALMQNTLSAYLVGFALCSLFIGAVSDAVGRRPALLGGMALFAGASIAVLFAPNIWTFIFLRFIEGLGAGVGQVVTQASVRDRFSGLDATWLNGMIALIFALCPALAPVLGGQIVVRFSWEAVFIFLALYALLNAAVIYFFLPETLPEGRRTPFRAGPLLSGYAMALKNRAYMAGAFSNCASFSGMLLYTSASADIILHILKMGPDDFAYLSVPMVASSMAGAFCCAWAVSKLGGKKAISAMLFMMTAVSAAATICGYALPLTYPFIILGPLIFGFGTSFCQPEMFTMNFDYFPNNRGVAASVQQCLQSFGFAFATSVIVPAAMGAMWRYTLASALLGLAALIFWQVSLRFRPGALKAAGVAEEHF